MKPCIRVTILFLLFLAIGCKKENDRTNVNLPPVANAGADQVILLPADSIELKGSGIDPDGSIESFRWSKVVGPVSFDILNPNEAVTKVKNLTEGVYEIVLIITDNDGASSNDFVTITVLPTIVQPATIFNYRSKQTGTWNDSSSWERYNGSRWINASKPPTNMDGEINVLSGHTITVSTPVEIDQVTIKEGGQLIIKSDLSLSDEYATTDDGYELINNGILEWQDGLLSLMGGYTTVTLVNNGNFIISGNNNTSSYWWDSDVRIINNGTITKTNTGITSLEALHLIKNTTTGIIKGIGTISVSGDIEWLPDAFSNNGTIDPGLPIGVLNIKKVIRPFSSTSNLNIEIKDKSGAGTGHDQLLFDNNITLNGILNVKETGTAVSNCTFTILSTSGKINGNFQKMNLPPGYSLKINDSSVDLVKN